MQDRQGGWENRQAERQRAGRTSMEVGSEEGKQAESEKGKQAKRQRGREERGKEAGRLACKQEERQAGGR